MYEKLIKVKRLDQEIIIPHEVYNQIYASGMYITLNKLKTTSRMYYQVMVCKKENGKLIFRKPLSRLMINAPSGKHVDHIDGDPLNNCFSNLRLATSSENGANRKKQIGTLSKYKGVNFSKGVWRAMCKKDGVNYSAGPFTKEIDAALAYNKLAIMLHGEFALCNIITT